MAVPVREIVKMASIVFGVRTSLIYSPARPQKVARARQAIYLVGLEQGWTLSHIGRVLDRDHTSVRYGSTNALEIAARDPLYNEQINSLREHVRHYTPPPPLRLPTFLNDQEPEALAA